MVHGYVRVEILNAHRYFVEPVNKGSQRLSLLLEDANQGDGGQVVQAACGELCLKLRHQHREAIGGEGRELRELAESSSLQRCGEHSVHDRISTVYKLMCVV